MQGKSMTPKEAAAALIGALPAGVSDSNLEEYGIEPVAGRAQGITRELLALNLFWIFAAVKAHIPQKYHGVVSELVLSSIEQGWDTIYPVGAIAWTVFLEDWTERNRRYERLVDDGASPLAVSTEATVMMEEQGLIEESDHRNLLTLLIDSVPVDTYDQLLKDVG